MVCHWPLLEAFVGKWQPITIHTRGSHFKTVSSNILPRGYHRAITLEYQLPILSRGHSIFPPKVYEMGAFQNNTFSAIPFFVKGVQMSTVMTYIWPQMGLLANLVSPTCPSALSPRWASVVSPHSAAAYSAVPLLGSLALAQNRCDTRVSTPFV